VQVSKARAFDDELYLHSACQDLITAANNAGGPDNISVILVQLIG
jgi:serine/threonine protein phosphatase PrpC